MWAKNDARGLLHHGKTLDDPLPRQGVCADMLVRRPPITMQKVVRGE